MEENNNNYVMERCFDAAVLKCFGDEDKSELILSILFDVYEEVFSECWDGVYATFQNYLDMMGTERDNRLGKFTRYNILKDIDVSKLPYPDKIIKKKLLDPLKRPVGRPRKNSIL